MRAVAELFLEFERLDRQRTEEGLSVAELERWSELEKTLGPLQETARGREGHEHRGSVRIPTWLNCSFTSAGELQDALITNMSRTGVFIYTNSPLPIGTEIELTIRIQQKGVEIRIPATIVSHNVGADHGQSGMGVRLSQDVPDVIRQIESLYQEEVQRQYSRDSGDRKASS